MDLPGHGDSPWQGEAQMQAFAQAVLETLDQAGVERFAVLGLSLGGMVAQALASLAPARVAALVLAHCSARTSEAGRALWQARLDQLAQETMQDRIDATLRRWFTPQFRTAAPLTLEWVAAMIRGTPIDAYRGAIRAIQQHDALGTLSQVAAPTLIVSGEADTATPPALGEAMAQAIPHARHVVLAGAPHLSSVEQAARFTELVGAFVAQAR
jgi:3-oxoadipate enol-lactonase